MTAVDDPALAALARPHGVAFPVVVQPDVSILVPVYGEYEMTVECLRTLAATVSRASFEVLVLDDESPDDRMGALAQVPGLRYVRAETNLGFLHNCNQGAAHARGRILLFLNNDTKVLPDFLDPLVDAIDADPTVGAVGSMLLYDNGVVQEAGGIVWGDGSGWNYGRHDTADNSRNLWLRDVDYCSGASLAVRRDLWDRLGGFDPRYAPAYYEDTDLCFGVRELGYRVVFQPRSRVVHLEGRSHGTDAQSGIKRQQTVNQQVFAAKWGHRLVDHFPPNPDFLYAARLRHRRPRIAVVDHLFPDPTRDSGSVRMSQLVETLHELGVQVHFIPMNLAAGGPLCDEWRSKGIEVFAGTFDLGDTLRQLAPALDAVLLSRPHVAARFLPDLRAVAPRLPVIYDMVDAHGLRELRRAELANDPVGARAARAYHALEVGLCGAADAVIAISDAEAAFMQQEAADIARFFVVSNIHPPVAQGPGPVGRDGVLFVGGYQHPPNVDAVQFLAHDVAPLLADPTTRITLAGAGPTADVAALASPTVTVPGWINDLTPLYDTSRVCVAPLRYGAGVKGKIGEALSHGVPVVTTSIGAEGLGLVHEETVLVADTAAEFAAAVDRLLTDDVLWLQLAAAGRRHIDEQFGRTAARRNVEAMLDVLLSPSWRR
jgi:GT2 family glycosyltransferase